MKNFITTNTPETFIDITNDFVYNFYNNSETQTTDNIIIDSVNNPYKYIKLRVSASAKYDKRIIGFYNNTSVDNLDSLSNKNLDEKDLSYFNHVSNVSPNMKNINYDVAVEEIKKINKFYDIDKKQHKSAIDFIQSNKKVSIDNNFTSSLLDSNKNNMFFTNKNKSDIVIYDSLVLTNEESLDSPPELKSLILNSKFKSFQKKSVYNSGVNYKNYYMNIGFLIEKYVVEEESYKKVCSYFKKSKENSSISRLDSSKDSHKIDYSFVLKDSGVKYGSTYKYLVYPVYITSIPSNKDYHTYDEFIVCDFPYITNNTLCKEAKRPVPPAQLSFKHFSKKNALRIEWSKPLEEQGDVKGYQVFKRHSIDDPFVLIKQIEFHNNNDFYERNINVSNSIVEKISNKYTTECYDYNFSLEKIAIFCICSIDAHGFVSNYSTQYGVRYNHNVKSCELDIISGPGAPLHMPNLLIPRKTKFFDNDDYLVTNTPVEEKVKKFTLYVTPEFNKINFNTTSSKSILSDSYKLSLFKIENSSTYVDDIKILKFNDENFI